ncbi:MAG: TadE/TadG family type IV pilus assembly protein [Actinomycetota bacterium]
MARRCGRGARRGARPGSAGQATVELALLLPVFFALLLLLVQVALVARDAIVVVHAARAAAREAAVTPDGARVRAAATRSLPRARARVLRRDGPGGDVVVEVAYLARTDLPIVGGVLPDLTLRSRAVLRVER